jgi:hypothetical protein
MLERRAAPLGAALVVSPLEIAFEMRCFSLAASLMLLAPIGCGERGRPYDCVCSVLTDFDDGTKHEVEVCSPNDARALEFGKGCAQSGAPAKVEGCVCHPIEGPACDLGRCVAKPR